MSWSSLSPQPGDYLRIEDFHLKYLSLLKIEFLNLKLLQKLFKRLLCMKNHKTQSIYTTRPNSYTPQDPNHVHHIKIYYEISLISSIIIN
jgi:hypothetical protein